MVLYKDVTEDMLGKLNANEVHNVPRAENKEKDVLSKLAFGGGGGARPHCPDVPGRRS